MARAVLVALEINGVTGAKALHIAQQLLDYLGVGECLRKRRCFIKSRRAAKNIDGVDIWLTGTLPRKYKIICYITDSRPGAEQSEWPEGTLTSPQKQRRTEATRSCSRPNRPITLAATRPGTRRLFVAAMSLQLLVPVSR
jgi:hypothetical protein